MDFSPEQTNAYHKAALLCSKIETCTADIMEKLKKWALSDIQAKPVIAKLKEENYLDDERFARAYVKDKYRFNHWGRQKIEYMLRAKHIPSEILEQAFEEIEEDTYTDGLRKLLEDKSKSIKAKDQYEKRNKLMRFAMGRGFEPRIVSHIFRELNL